MEEEDEIIFENREEADILLSEFQSSIGRTRFEGSTFTKNLVHLKKF